MDDRAYIEKIKGLVSVNAIEKLHEDEQAEEQQRLKVLFSNVFLNNPDGREVLAFLLDVLLYNKKISLPEEIALHNTAVGILEIMGLDGCSEIVNKVF